MKKLIFFLILFLSLSPFAFGADLNWSLEGTATGIYGNIGVPSNIRDDDEGTYYGLGGGAGPRPINATYSCEVAFAEVALTINEVAVVHSATGTINVTNCDISLYYGGSWHIVADNIDTGSWAKKTSSQAGDWSNVSKIKLDIRLGIPSYQSGGHLTYELRAWGPPNYSDIGLRVKTSSGIIKIGTQSLDGHKLRVRKGDTTYGIPLLATDDAYASPIRIYDGSAVKALPKVD